jgi:hypothetical protein
LIADAPFPTSFTSITWEGTYNNKGIQVVWFANRWSTPQAA